MKVAGRRVSSPSRILTPEGWAIRYRLPDGAQVDILCAAISALRPRDRQAYIERRILSALS